MARHWVVSGEEITGVAYVSMIPMAGAGGPLALTRINVKAVLPHILMSPCSSMTLRP